MVGRCRAVSVFRSRFFCSAQRAEPRDLCQTRRIEKTLRPDLVPVKEKGQQQQGKSRHEKKNGRKKIANHRTGMRPLSRSETCLNSTGKKKY